MTDDSLSHGGDRPGSLGALLIGFAMACVGGYLLTNQVGVAGAYWAFYGANTFGVTLIPMLIGVAMLFWSSRSLLAWLLTIGGGLFILAGVIANMRLYFQPTSLFNTLVTLVVLVGGLTLVARSLLWPGVKRGE